MRSVVNTATNVARSILRSQAIARIVLRQGLGRNLATLGLQASRFGFSWVGIRTPARSLSQDFGDNLAVLFSELGPLFIKLGQMLAMRPDIVGENIAQSLQVLYSTVQPVPYSRIKKVLRQQWGLGVLRGEFQRIESVPLASGSLGQVHRARLKDGTDVVIKVLRPGVRETVQIDLWLLKQWVFAASKVFRRVNLEELFSEFEQATLAELDLRQEAKNNSLFERQSRRLFSLPDVVFPKVFEALSTEAVLVMEPMAGKQVSGLVKGSTVARTVARRSVEAVLAQIFEHGTFHADPHAGNLFFIQETGQVGFIDLGLVGYLRKEDKKVFLRILSAVLKREVDLLASVLSEFASSRTDRQQLNLGVQDLIRRHSSQGLSALSIPDLVSDLMKLCHQHGVQLPHRYVMLLRSFLVLEGLARSLDPNFKLVDIVPQAAARGLVRAMNPFRRWK